MNDIRKNTDSFGKWKRWWLKVESVPLDPEKLTADVPQSLRCLLTPSLWGYKGGGAVAEIKGGGMIFTSGLMTAWVITMHAEILFLFDLPHDRNV